MIPKNELRLGNMVYVDGNRDTFFTVVQLKAKVAFVKGKAIFQVEYEMLTPVLITSDTLSKCGFKEIQNVTIKSVAIEYALPVPVLGDDKHDIYAVVDNNDPKRTFAKTRINGLHVGNKLVFLHQIQNIYHALVNKEMLII